MKKKMLLKIVIIMICILAILFIVNLVRKVVIIQKYSEKNKEYASITNFYQKGMTKDAVIETWRKDNLALRKITTDKTEQILYWGEDDKWMIAKSEDSKVATQFDHDDEFMPIPMMQNSTITCNDIWEVIRLAFVSKITTEKVNGEDCYKIYMADDFEEYVSKKDFLLLKNINGSTEVVNEYKVKGVTQENVKMPDITDYTIKRNQ